MAPNQADCMNKPLSGYDIIGDIHGHAEELKIILQQMGYSLRKHVWQHPERKAIFVGDYIDRGPEIREALSIVKNMTDAGAAYAIMGNHEYNALAFHYHNTNGGHIREHSIKNLLQHYETIKQFQGYEAEWEVYLAWFANLPLFLEMDGIRVVHACWDDERIAFLNTIEWPLAKQTLLEAHRKRSDTWKAFEEVLKGKEICLPDGHYFIDKDGNKRTDCRSKWWIKPQGLTLEQYLFHAPITVRNIVLSSEYSSDGYSLNAPTVFFGHYWLDAEAGPVWQAPNVCCLDYSVAKKGKLVAYRHYFEQPNSDDKFVVVNSI